jgi:predicted transcriptional regulator
MTRGERKQEQYRANLEKYGSELIHLYVECGLSQAAVGKRLGVSQASVGHWLRDLGIAARPPANVGEKNGRFKDGTESRLYRTMIRKEKCSRCESTDQLVIHHKDGNHYSNVVENLEVMCSPCHSRMHKTEWWNSQQPKTHCSKGHPLSGENLLVNRLGHRSCRTCRIVASREYEKKRIELRRQRRLRRDQRVA